MARRHVRATVLLTVATLLFIVAIGVPDWQSDKCADNRRHKSGLWSGTLCTQSNQLQVSHKPPSSNETLRTWWNKLVAIRAFAFTAIVVGVVGCVLGWSVVCGRQRGFKDVRHRLKVSITSWCAFSAALCAVIADALYVSIAPVPPGRLDVGFFLFTLGLLLALFASLVYDIRGFMSRLRRKVVLLALLVLYCCLPMIGGVCNRIRGGWRPVTGATFPKLGDNVITHDGVGRFIMAAPTAFIVAVGVWDRRRCLPAFLIFTILTFFSLFVGWGCYFSIGRSPQWPATPTSHGGRAGVFDWLVGREDAGWDYHRRWSRDIVAMSLRGALWTTSTGLPMYLAGYGALPLMSGLAMGIWYDIAYSVPTTMTAVSQGTSNGEFMWGFWIWVTLIVSLVHYHNSRAAAHAPPSKWGVMLASVGRVAVHTWVLFLEVVFTVSAVSYGYIVRDATRQHIDALRNRRQTFLGLMVVLVATVLTHVSYGVWRLWRWIVKGSTPVTTRISSLHDTVLHRRVSSEGMPLQHPAFGDGDAASVASVTTVDTASDDDDDDEAERAYLEGLQPVTAVTAASPLLPHVPVYAPSTASLHAPWTFARFLRGVKRDLRRLAWLSTFLYRGLLVGCLLWFVAWLVLGIDAVVHNNHILGCKHKPWPAYCP